MKEILEEWQRTRPNERLDGDELARIMKERDDDAL